MSDNIKDKWTIQEVLSAERAAVGDKYHHTLRQLHDDMVRCGARSVIRFDLTGLELRMLEKFSPDKPTAGGEG